MLYGPAHEAVLRYARWHVRQPGRILDVGCGTGRLAARRVSAYRQAQVAGVDASTEMIRHAAAVPHGPAAGFAAGCAEELPFADAVFGLVVVTLSMSHWRDAAAGLGEIRRVMAPDATLIAAEAVPARPSGRVVAAARYRKPGLPGGLPSLISASGLRIRHIEPIRTVALEVGAALIAAGRPC